MPQVATTDEKKPIENTVGPGSRVTEIAHEKAATAVRHATQAPQKTAWVTEPRRSRSASIEPFGAVAPRSLFEMFNVGGSIGIFWFNLAQAQMTAATETLGKLAAARDWRDRLEIQSSFVQGNLARMSEGVARSAELAVDLVSSCAAMARCGDVKNPA